MKRFILTLLFTAFTPLLCLADWGSQPCEQLPAPRQAPAKVKIVEGVNGLYFGMDASHLHKDGKPHYHLNGKEVEKHHVVAALTLSDDSAKPFVTFIGLGREDLCKAFLATPEAARCRVNSYDVADWHVTGGFVTSGTPTVYVQNPKGEVLYRGDHPTVEVVQAEARKAQPDYDPAKDPTGADVYPTFVVSAVDYVKANGLFVAAIVFAIVSFVMLLKTKRS